MVKEYILEMEIFHHATVSLHSKYNSIHASDENLALILFTYYLFLNNVFCLFQLLPVIFIRSHFLFCITCKNEEDERVHMTHNKYFITPLYPFIHNIKKKAFHKSHAFILVIYLFICLFRCFLYLKFLPTILLQKSFLILYKMQMGGR